MAKSRESLKVAGDVDASATEPRGRGRPKGSGKNGRVTKPYEPTGRPRGRPPSANPKPKVSTGRPRGRPKGSGKSGSTVTKTPTKVGGTPGKRGRPAKTPVEGDQAASKDAPKRGRGRPSLNAVAADKKEVGQVEDEEGEDEDVDAEDAEDVDVAEGVDEDDNSNSE
ncbi:hypothetical protein E4U21_003476 [Claviceps maximensis]|nr:hypothetical protein E4U21_003476 [Claviceps maximensis]